MNATMRRLTRGNAFLTTDSDAFFDGVMRAAGAALGVPMAAVAFEQDDDWLVRASLGGMPDRLAREGSPFTVVAETGDYFAVSDLVGDERFRSFRNSVSDGPARGYAGIPIALRGGRVMGCLAVIDRAPRVFSEDEIALLESLGNAISANIERRLGLPAIGRPKAMLLASALEHTSDPIRILRIQDAGIVDLMYQNRAAVDAPSVSMLELDEALRDEDEDALRAGAQPGSLAEMRARRFEVLGETYAVTVERDVTKHARLEEAFDHAASVARELTNRYADLALIASADAPHSERRISKVLDFVLREFRMGTAIFSIDSGGSRRHWEARGEKALGVAIPEEFVDAALANETSVRLVRMSESNEATFSSESMVVSGSHAVALCLGRARTTVRCPSIRLDAALLRTCLTIAAGEIATSALRRRRANS